MVVQTSAKGSYSVTKAPEKGLLAPTKTELPVEMPEEELQSEDRGGGAKRKYRVIDFQKK
jgi:hypothetical protein